MFTLVAGTRPTDIKCAALYPAMKKGGLPTKILHTGQHFSESMHAIPIKTTEYGNLKNNLGGMIEWLIPRIEGTVIVFGDTNTTLAGAIAAKQKKRPLVHIEAGMRCGDPNMIEEWNRIMVDSISQWNLVTCKKYISNVPKGTGHIVGDLQYDLFKQRTQWPQSEGFPLLTLHRAEHTEDPEQLRQLLQLIKSKFKQWPVSFVAHPRTLEFCMKHKISLDEFEVNDPMPYHEFENKLLRSGYVITDSGGVSKEAAWALKPIFILREKSEWGFQTVGEWGERWSGLPEEGRFTGSDFPIDSGDGNAAQKIVDLLRSIKGS